jgi:hypothetical protein
MRLYQYYKDRDVVIVGLAVDDDLSTAKGFVHEFFIPYSTAFDTDDMVYRAYSGEVLPTTIVVDRTGRLNLRIRGALYDFAYHDFMNYLDKLLAK